MKCHTTVDGSRRPEDDEVHITVSAMSDRVREIEDFVRGGVAELIGYGERDVVSLHLGDVTCFTVENGKVYALTDTERLRIRLRLYQVEELLGSDFVKINQSCIANIRKIGKFETSIGGALRVRFRNGHTDYVSRRQLQTVKERIGFRL